MTTLSTTSINWLANQWEDVYGTAVLSGVVGDLAHKARGGYHISREDQGSSNYSVIRPDDKPGNGPSDRAAAIDMTMSTSDMIKCHTRLRNIWKNRANDPRMKYINAWNGWDGEGDAGRYDVVKGTISFASADHKWHIHLEIRRKYVNDMNAMRAILSMLKGESAQGAISPVEDDDMTKAEMLALLNSAEGKKAISDAVLGASAGNKAYPTRTVRQFINDLWGARDYLISDTKGTASSGVGPTSMLGKLSTVADQLKAFASKDLVDETAVANALVSNAAFVNAFAASVAEKLPTGVEVSPAELAEAMKTALREGVAQ
jgi:hypothetical protein